jgi:ATP-dependent protease HslVU (ClpYQ) peptidase subunit
MAGDGRICSGSTIFGSNAQKVRLLKDGRIVGVAGNARYQAPFIAWLIDGGDFPELDEEFEALVLNRDGSVQGFDYKGRWLQEELPTATGSGREFALAAMDLGASPEDAVKIACERDMLSGGTITTLHLEPPLKTVA